MKRRVWVNDDPESNYSRCPQCDKTNSEDLLIKETGTRTSATWCPHLKEEVDGGDTQTYHVYEVTTVKRVNVCVYGDPHVGIPHQDFKVELHLDSGDYDDEQQLKNVCNFIRVSLQQLYEELYDARVRVTFDYEEDA